MCMHLFAAFTGCGHCKKFKPEFAAAATELKGQAVSDHDTGHVCQVKQLISCIMFTNKKGGCNSAVIQGNTHMLAFVT